MSIGRASFLALVQGEMDKLDTQIRDMDTKIDEKVETAKSMWADSKRALEIKRENLKVEMLQLAATPEVQPSSTEERYRNKVKRQMYAMRQTVGSGIANVRNAKKATPPQKDTTGAPTRYFGISL